MPKKMIFLRLQYRGKIYNLLHTALGKISPQQCLLPRIQLYEPVQCNLWPGPIPSIEDFGTQGGYPGTLGFAV